MTTQTRRPPTNRERTVLAALIDLHTHHGILAQFDNQQIAAAVGPCAGSLAGLTIQGYVRQRMAEGNRGRARVMYSVTEPGYALFAGIEGMIDV